MIEFVDFDKSEYTFLKIWIIFVFAFILSCFIIMINNKDFKLYESSKNDIVSKVNVINNNIEYNKVEIFKSEEEKQIASAVEQASKKYGVPSYIIFAIIATESNLYGTDNINEHNILEVNPKAKSGANCIGLMQLSKYAVTDYNNINNTNLSLNDMYNISDNIEVGTWYFSRFSKRANNWVEQYIIYNVGFNEFNKTNNYVAFNYDGTYKTVKNGLFYLNDVMPPSEEIHGIVNEESFSPYNGKKRFEKCLEICFKKFYFTKY